MTDENLPPGKLPNFWGHPNSTETEESHRWPSIGCIVWILIIATLIILPRILYKGGDSDSYQDAPIGRTRGGDTY